MQFSYGLFTIRMLANDDRAVSDLNEVINACFTFILHIWI